MDEAHVASVIAGFMDKETLKHIAQSPEVLNQPAEMKRKALEFMNMMQGSEQTININKRPEEVEKIRKSGIAPVYIDCDLKNKEQWYLDVREVFEQPKPKGKKVLSIPLSDLTSRYQDESRHELKTLYH